MRSIIYTVTGCGVVLLGAAAAALVVGDRLLLACMGGGAVGCYLLVLVLSALLAGAEADRQELAR